MELGTLAFSNIRGDAQYHINAAGGVDNGAERGLNVTFPAGCIYNFLLGKKFFVPVVYDFIVIPAKARHKPGIGDDISVGFAQEFIRRSVKHVSQGLVDQDEAPLPVLDKNQIFIDVDNFQKKSPLFFNFLLRPQTRQQHFLFH